MGDIELKNVKGCKDYSSNEQIIRNNISDTLQYVFEKYGYKPLKTPIICYYDLLALKYDEENDILKEIYKVTDQAKRELALRYDLTVPFAKYISLNKNMKFPFKRYEIGEVFRDGPIKLGRDREFIQCDVDCVGIEGQLIEAELVCLYIEAFKKMGIDIIVKFNNRKYLAGIISEAGVSEELITDTITVIDKFEKLSQQQIEKEFLKNGLNKEQIEKIITYFNMDIKDIQAEENTMLKEGIEEINTLIKYLDRLNMMKYVKFTPSLARGQEYYTGTIFEVYSTDNYITSSLGGGGRYDKMITDFINDGKKYPAVGISFGLNVIYEILKKQKEDIKSLTDLFIIPLDTEIECLELAEKFRKREIGVEIEMTNRKLRKSLDYANSKNIPYVLILGENELKENKVTLKDMNKNEQYEINLDNIIDYMDNIIFM